jgi:hypothetical protein
VPIRKSLFSRHPHKEHFFKNHTKILKALALVGRRKFFI